MRTIGATVWEWGLAAAVLSAYVVYCLIRSGWDRCMGIRSYDELLCAAGRSKADSSR